MPNATQTIAALALSVTAALASLSACGKEPPKSAPAASAPVGTRQPSMLQGAAPPAVAGTCDACRARWCKNYEGEGFDVVKGCFERPDPKIVPTPDPNFATDCVAAYRCAFKHDCGFDPARGPVKCYCGSRNVDECLEKGPADDAACAQEWKTATRGTTNTEVLNRFDRTEYPSGWAFHLIECDRNYCGPKSGWGTCTP